MSGVEAGVAEFQRRQNSDCAPSWPSTRTRYNSERFVERQLRIGLTVQIIEMVSAGQAFLIGHGCIPDAACSGVTVRISKPARYSEKGSGRCFVNEFHPDQELRIVRIAVIRIADFR